MKDENYFVVHGWMINKLNLKGNELIAYATIYGFSQDGASEYNGSVNYLREWMNASRQTVFNVLSSLVSKSLIIKKESVFNGIKFVSYKANADLLNMVLGGQNFVPPVNKICTSSKESSSIPVQKLDVGSTEIVPNKELYKELNNKEDILHISKKTNHAPYDEIVDRYNSICTNLPKVSKLTDSRKKAIDKAWAIFNEDIYKGFEMANSNSFLIGNNRTGWKADFDFLIRPDKITKVLEGSYSCDSKASVQQKRDYSGQYSNDVFEEI